MGQTLPVVLTCCLGRPQVARHLKALGLRRGQLLPEQLEQLRRLFEEHRGRRACYRLVAEGMNNGCAAVQWIRQPGSFADPAGVTRNENVFFMLRSLPTLCMAFTRRDYRRMHAQCAAHSAPLSMLLRIALWHRQ